jgi:hypothetical protein
MKVTNNLYIYLARLDKKGIKVLSGFSYSSRVYPTRINDVRQLAMHPDVAVMIEKETRENRMQYELYAESAESFNELKNSLRERGYTNLPMQQFTGHAQPTTINAAALVTENSTMIRRRSRQVR